MPHPTTNLLVKNTGPIHQAKLQFQGLTLLTGSTNTGKSTLAKVLYSILSSQIKPYTGKLAPLQEALKQLYQFEVSCGLQEEEIVLADLAPNIYLSFYQRAVEKVVQFVMQLGKECKEQLYRADVQQVLKSCNILKHLGGVDYVEELLWHLRTYQLAMPKEKLVGKAAHDQLIQELFPEGYVQQQAMKEGALLDLYQGNQASIYLQVKDNATQKWVVKGQVFSEVILMEVEAVLALLQQQTVPKSPIYTQSLLQKIFTPQQEIWINAPSAEALQNLLSGKLILKEQQLLYQQNDQTTLEFSQLSPALQQATLIQNLVLQGHLPPSSLLILEEPVFKGEKQLLEALLAFLLEQEVFVLVITNNAALVTFMTGLYQSSPETFPFNCYQGKMTAKGSVF